MMTTSPESEDRSAPEARKATRILFLWILTLTVGAIVAGLAVRHFQLGWIGAGIMMLFLMAGTAWLVRVAARRGVELGCASPAILRYNRRMLLFSMIYMSCNFAAILAYKRFHVEGPALWLAGFAPSIGVCGMIWAMGRLIAEESDEYLRFHIVKQALFATGAVLVVTTIWGFLEQFALVPHLPLWVVMPIFAVALGASNFVRWVKA